MKFLREFGWRTLALELLVVFVGLLAALQVDQWREDRSYRDAEMRYLQRLDDDLEASIASLHETLELLQPNSAGVRHVSESLNAGKIIDDDSSLFETGLIYVGHLPSLSIHRSAYDEMVASGMFARLQSEDLKKVVSQLYATQDVVERNFSWWRGDIGDLQDRLSPNVRYYSEDEPIASDNSQIINEPKRRIEFAFDALQQDKILKNQYYWATDIHSDWVEWTKVVLELAENSRAVLIRSLDSN